MWVIRHFSHVHVQPFATQLAIAHQAPLSWDSPGKKWRSGVVCPLPGDPPKIGIKSLFPAVLALRVDSLSLGYQGSPYSNFKETECRKRTVSKRIIINFKNVILILSF